MILVVEDDETLRNSVAGLLQRKGYAVRAAASGNEAIQILDSGETIELIICDLYMPNGDGTDVLDHIRRRDPSQPPFILITGQTDLTISSDSAGIAEFITKPIAPRELLDVVARYLRT